MRDYVNTQIDKLAASSKAEKKTLELEKNKLERKQRKLLQAHYEDAIPLSLLKEEQAQISKSLTSINEQIKAYDMELDAAKENLRYVFELLEDCGKVYKYADDQSRRCLNQALFKKILVHDDLSLSVEYNAPFEAIISPSALYLAANDKGNEILPDQESLFTRMLQAQSTIDEIEEAEIVKQNEQHDDAAHFDINSQNYYFFDEGLSKNILVRKAGLEPARYCYHRHLKPARLPIPPLPHSLYCSQYFAVPQVFLKDLREMGLEPTRFCNH